MKKILLSLLLLCSLATYADTYYSQYSEMWDPWIDEWTDIRYKKVKIEVTSNQVIIYDDYTLKFNIIIANGTQHTDNGTPYLDYIATMESDYFNLAFVIYNNGTEMNIVVFKRGTDEGLLYHCNIE